MRRIAICLAIVTALSLGAVAPSGAASTTPTATATAVGADDVRVNWTFTSTSAAKYRKLQIERADAGGAFSLLFTRSGAGLKSSYTDRSAGARGASYRLRVVDTSTGAAVNTPWSNVVSVPPATTTTTTTTTPPLGRPALNSDQAECPAADEAQIWVLINDERDRVGRPALQFDENLANAARARSIHYADTGVLNDHVGQDATVKLYFTNWANVAENLAEGVSNPDMTLTGWLSSPVHASNIRTTSGRGAVSCVLSRVYPGYGRFAYWTFLAESGGSGWTPVG